VPVTGNVKMVLAAFIVKQLRNWSFGSGIAILPIMIARGDAAVF
jgi:hypothetical protein